MRLAEVQQRLEIPHALRFFARSVDAGRAGRQGREKCSPRGEEHLIGQTESRGSPENIPNLGASHRLFDGWGRAGPYLVGGNGAADPFARTGRPARFLLQLATTRVGFALNPNKRWWRHVISRRRLGNFRHNTPIARVVSIRVPHLDAFSSSRSCQHR